MPATKQCTCPCLRRVSKMPPRSRFRWSPSTSEFAGPGAAAASVCAVLSASPRSSDRAAIAQCGLGDQLDATVRAALPPVRPKRRLTPVRLPPGRLRLATRPSLTGSAPIVKTIGMVVVAALATDAPRRAGCDDHSHPQTNEFGRQGNHRSMYPSAQRYSIATVWPSMKPVLLSPSAKCRQAVCQTDRGMALRKPITGIAGCCARAASGHAAAAPPRSVMNSRRSHSITSSARASSIGGTVRPRALAVMRLRTKSNLVGCSTGMSAGFAPRSILSTKSPARRNRSEVFAP